MKNLFLLLLSFGLFASCKDREPDPNVLPEATQTGANTGGALVDGKVWVAKIEYPDLNPGGNNTQYEYVNGEYKLKVVLRQINNVNSSIGFYISDISDITTTSYTLANDSFRATFSYKLLEDYFTDNENSGTLTITKFDKVNKTVSGTFSYKAKNSNGQVVTISEGRFDKKFL